MTWLVLNILKAAQSRAATSEPLHGRLQRTGSSPAKVSGALKTYLILLKFFSISLNSTNWFNEFKWELKLSGIDFVKQNLKETMYVNNNLRREKVHVTQAKYIIFRIYFCNLSTERRGKTKIYLAQIST